MKGLFDGRIFNLLLSDNIDDQVQKIFQRITTEKVIFTFCGGISGICWFLNYITKKGKLDLDIEASFSVIDEHLARWMKNQIRLNNFDFLHGALGVVMYFLSRKSNKLFNYVSLLIDEIAIKEGSIVKFKTQDLKYHNEECNLSLSHGMASQIVFLSKSIENNINTNKSIKLLTGYVNFYINNINPKEMELGSIFSNRIVEGKNI